MHPGFRFLLWKMWGQGKNHSSGEKKKNLPSELKTITGVLLLQNKKGLEEGSKHRREVAGLENIN